MDGNNTTINLLKQLVRTRTDIRLWPSTDVNIATIDLLVRTRSDIKLRPSGCSIINAMYIFITMPDLEQIHMQVLLNRHLAAFLSLHYKSKSGQMTI